jgi:hypothetical protein
MLEERSARQGEAWQEAAYDTERICAANSTSRLTVRIRLPRNTCSAVGVSCLPGNHGATYEIAVNSGHLEHRRARITRPCADERAPNESRVRQSQRYEVGCHEQQVHEEIAPTIGRPVYSCTPFLIGEVSKPLAG